MVHKCLRCGYEDKQFFNVKRHINRKKLCDPVFSNTNREECLLFLKSDDKNYGVYILMKEIEKLKKNTTVISNSGDRCNLTNFNGDNNNVNNINITINSYEKTDYSVLKDKIHTCIKNGAIDEAKLIKLLHFNKDAPQNHNIMIENKRDKTIKVFNGEKFEDSEHSGREGIWKFGKKVVDKTGEQEFVETDETLFDAIEQTKDINHIIHKDSKCDKLNKMESVLYNGKETVKNTHLHV
jgi:hypothetical protein